MPHRKVRMIQPLAGRDYVFASGQEVDLDEETAKRYVAAKIAVYVDGVIPEKRTEKATSRKARKSQKR